MIPGSVSSSEILKLSNLIDRCCLSVVENVNLLFGKKNKNTKHGYDYDLTKNVVARFFITLFKKKKKSGSF